MFGAHSHEKAYLAPFLGFLLIFALGGDLAHFFDGSPRWFLSDPNYWVFPLQTLVGGALVVRYWRFYELRLPRHSVLAVLVGVAAFLIWTAPPVLQFSSFIASFIQKWLGLHARGEGFNPLFFGPSGWGYWLNLGFRFIRLVVVVPFVEEIFWRGFLLRYLIDEDIARTPFGAFSWKSFGIVTVGFCLEHMPADWPAAIATGVLYNLLACRSRSLSACVLAHAVTNLLLGGYVLHTRQWGFW